MTKGRMLLGLIALALGSGAALGDKIELRTAARVEAARGVTIGDVARLEGPNAQRIGSVVLLAPGKMNIGDPVAIDVGQVREALDAHGVNWALLSLRGGRCDLLPAAAVAPATTPAPGGELVDTHVPSVRTVVERRLRETFGVSDEGRIRIRFDERDAELLGLALADGGAGPLLVEAHTTGASSRVPMSVSVYRGDSLIESRHIRVDVQIEREVCVVRAPVERRSSIGATDVVVERRWLTPDIVPATLDECVGAEAKSRLDVGQTLTQSHVVPPIVVSRGEQVMVHYLSGPVILKTKARALEDGRVGERIRLEVIGSKRRLEARVDAPGRAVVRNEPMTPGVLEDPGTDAPAVGALGGGAAPATGVRVTRSE